MKRRKRGNKETRKQGNKETRKKENLKSVDTVEPSKPQPAIGRHVR